MGRKDAILKEYLSIPAIFSDLFNGALFKGKQLLSEEILEAVDSTTTAIVDNKKGRSESIQKYRDVIKKAAIGTEFVLLGIENQMNVHYVMPVRNMLYDSLSYTKQAEERKREHKQKKDLRGDEYLSGFSKTDKLIPIITLAVYYGEV